MQHAHVFTGSCSEGFLFFFLSENKFYHPFFSRESGKKALAFLHRQDSRFWNGSSELQGQGPVVIMWKKQL